MGLVRIAAAIWAFFIAGGAMAAETRPAIPVKPGGTVSPPAVPPPAPAPSTRPSMSPYAIDKPELKAPDAYETSGPKHDEGEPGETGGTVYRKPNP